MYLVVKEPAVYHYGTLRAGLHNLQISWHHEGDTLSVSMCPDDWFSLSPNNDASVELWEIFRKDSSLSRFIDLARLSSHNRSEVDTWAIRHGFGTLGAPDYNNLIASYGRKIPTHLGDLPLLLAWAKTKEVDGIWFSEIINAGMPRSSRGGIFQNRLHLFDSKSLGARGAATWPSATLPKVDLVLL